MILLFTNKNEASLNIAQSLIQKCFEQSGKDEWSYKNVKMIDTKVESILDVPTDFKTDLIIVLSSHKSKQYRKMLTCHVPGNWDNADFGGENRTLNIAPINIMKTIVINMKKLAAQRLQDFEVQMEVDHHGPTCDVPIVYVEIGPTETEFNNKTAAEIVAESLIEAIDNKKNYEAAFAVGGGHYPEKFNSIIFEGNVGIGHILPKYRIKNFDENMFKQAVEKNVEKIGKVFILKNEFNTSQKEMIKQLCKKYNIEYSEL